MILPAQTIREMRPVSPFSERQVTNGLSYGLSPAGYDVRIAESLILMSGGFALASTVERFDMPSDVLAYVKDKSTWARRGLCVQNTVIEPGWRGYLTLELTNHASGPLAEPIVLTAGDPVAQIVFHRLEAATEQPYAGKYQDQRACVQPAIFDAAASNGEQ